MQNGKFLLSMFIGAACFLTGSNRIYSQTADIFKEGVTRIAEVKIEERDKKIKDFDNRTDLLSYLRGERILIFNQAKYDSREVTKAVRVIKGELYRQGYQDAVINILGERISDEQAKLIFTVERGARIPVSEINFVGNENVASADLIKALKTCIDDRWKIFDRRFYDYCVQKNVRQVIFSKGYLKGQARLKSQRVGDNMIVTIEVREGTRYRIGKIEVEGLNVLSKEQFFEALMLKPGAIADGAVITDFLYEKLKKIYRDRGYLLYDGELSPEFVNSSAQGQEEEESTVNIKFTIYEGNRFRLRKIEIVSPELLKIQKIRKLFGLVEGEIFSQEKFENGIRRINEAKEFGYLDKDKDVELRADEESGDIDLVIMVGRK